MLRRGVDPSMNKKTPPRFLVKELAVRLKGLESIRKYNSTRNAYLSICNQTYSHKTNRQYYFYELYFHLNFFSLKKSNNGFKKLNCNPFNIDCFEINFLEIIFQLIIIKCLDINTSCGYIVFTSSVLSGYGI